MNSAAHEIRSGGSQRGPGADRLHRDHIGGQDASRTIELTADDMRRVLSETRREPESLLEGIVLRAW